MKNNFDKPFVNYYACTLDETAAVLAMEIYDGECLVDVDLLTPYRAEPELCKQRAIQENKDAIKRGDHVSQYRAMQRERSVAA
jgi:hypothetical protein